MDFLSALLISLALSMDSFAVSTSCAVATQKPRFVPWLKVAFCFSIVQSAFVFSGWTGGFLIKEFFSKFGQFLAVLLLLIIGIKMIVDALYLKESEQKIRTWNLRILIVLALATSVDALVVGFGLGLLLNQIVFLVLTVGAVTFFMVMTGGFLGKHFGKFIKKRSLMIGGITLVIIGLKILSENI